MLSPNMIIFVFIIGIIPFIIATYEFLRCIAVGATFGTQSDSVIIIPNKKNTKPSTASITSITPTTTTPKAFNTNGENNNLQISRGQQILGNDALIVAYILFTIAASIIILELNLVISTGI